MRMRTRTCACVIVLALGTIARSWAISGSIAGPAAAQQPADDKSLAASDILRKTLAVYQTGKSYHGDWAYVLKEGDAVQKLAVELRSKGPTKVLFHVHPPANGADKDLASRLGAIPEVRVVLDGKNAWFENTTQKVYYKVPLPKNVVTSPFMFFPQMSTVGDPERGEDQEEGGRKIAVIFAKTKSGGLSRMEIDTRNFHIVRIACDEVTGVTRTLSTLTIEKEEFDSEIADNTFTYKPDKAFKEIPAPSEASVIFASAPPEKTGKDK